MNSQKKKYIGHGEEAMGSGETHGPTTPRMPCCPDAHSVTSFDTGCLQLPLLPLPGGWWLGLKMSTFEPFYFFPDTGLERGLSTHLFWGEFWEKVLSIALILLGSFLVNFKVLFET